jgi:hypothetical protein
MFRIRIKSKCNRQAKTSSGAQIELRAIKGESQSRLALGLERTVEEAKFFKLRA